MPVFFCNARNRDTTPCCSYRESPIRTMNRKRFKTLPFSLDCNRPEKQGLASGTIVHNDKFKALFIETTYNECVVQEQ